MQNIIGQRIAVARKSVGLSQAGLGRKIGKSSQSVNMWETGKSKPGRESLIDISRATGKSVQWLLTADLSQQGDEDTLTDWLAGGRIVAVVDPRRAARREFSTEANDRVYAHFPCGERSFAVTLVNDSCADKYPKGSRWIIDPDAIPEPGNMVFAGVGDDLEPVYGELQKSSDGGKIVTLVVPLNEKWAPRRSDIETIDIIGKMTEAVLKAP